MLTTTFIDEFVVEARKVNRYNIKAVGWWVTVKNAEGQVINGPEYGTQAVFPRLYARRAIRAYLNPNTQIRRWIVTIERDNNAHQ